MDWKTTLSYISGPVDEELLTTSILWPRIEFFEIGSRELLPKSDIVASWLSRMSLFGSSSPSSSCPKTQTNSRPARGAVAKFIHHHYRERNHQGLGNALTEAEECVGSPYGNVRCRKRLGGLLSYYLYSAKVDPALIVRFRPAMVGCFWPIFLFADHSGAGRSETNQVRCARMNK